MPETLRFVTPLIAPSASRLPVIVSELPPPVTVLPLLIVVPTSVVPPVRTTASV